MTTPPIREFRGEHWFLSNFYPSPLKMRMPLLPEKKNSVSLFQEKMWQWEFYPTAEHAFQALKSLDPDERFRISQAHSPGAAKGMGRRVTLRPDWESVKLSAMRCVVFDKFNQSTFLQGKLVATGSAELIEGNTWGDKFWGVDLATGEGENHLGEILMSIRGALVFRGVPASD